MPRRGGCARSAGRQPPSEWGTGTRHGRQGPSPAWTEVAFSARGQFAEQGGLLSRPTLPVRPRVNLMKLAPMGAGVLPGTQSPHAPGLAPRRRGAAPGAFCEVAPEPTQDGRIFGKWMRLPD